MADATAPIENQVEQLSLSTPPEPEKPHPSGLSLEERFQLCRSVAEECVSEEELRRLLNKPVPIAYDGFEPSGAAVLMECCWIHPCHLTGTNLIFPCRPDAHSTGCHESHQCESADKSRMPLQVLGGGLVRTTEQQDG